MTKGIVISPGVCEEPQTQPRHHMVSYVRRCIFRASCGFFVSNSSRRSSPATFRIRLFLLHTCKHQQNRMRKAFYPVTSYRSTRAANLLGHLSTTRPNRPAEPDLSQCVFIPNAKVYCARCFGRCGKKESRGAPRDGLSMLYRLMKCTTILGRWYYIQKVRLTPLLPPKHYLRVNITVVL